MSSIFSSQSVRTNDIESVGGGPLDIGRFSTGTVRVGSSDNTVSVGDALSIFVDDIQNNYIDTIGTNPLLIGRNASEITIGSSTTPVSITSSAISLTGATTVSTTLGVSGITTASGGIRTLNIDTIGTNILNDNSKLTIGGTRATGLTIGRTDYSTIINSIDAFPLRVNHIETVGATDELKIGIDSTGLVTLGSGNNSVLIADAIGIYTDMLTGDNFIDILNGPSSLFIGTNANGITIGSSGIPIILEGQVSISTSGSIPTPNATTARVAQSFGTTFTSTLPPKVYLTYDAGSTSTNIITVCLAGFVGIAGAWTGFYYLTSTSSAGVADSKLNWVAIA